MESIFKLVRDLGTSFSVEFFQTFTSFYNFTKTVFYVVN